MENDNALTPSESTRLVELESEIEKNLDAVLAVGRALREIQEHKLYRSRYPTFARYINERWKMSRAHGYRQIQFVKDVEMSPTGDKPETERAARAKRAKPKSEATSKTTVESRSEPTLTLLEAESQFRRMLGDWGETLSSEELFKLLDHVEEITDEKREELEET